MVLEPAMLGFEAKGPPLLHDHEEHDQGLMLVDKRPSAMRTSRLLLPKAFKERKQQLDIVGKGRCDHGRASWRVWQLSSREDLLVPTMSMPYAHSSVICECSSPHHRRS